MTDTVNERAESVAAEIIQGITDMAKGRVPVPTIAANINSTLTKFALAERREAESAALERVATRLQAGTLTGGKHPVMAKAIRALKDKP